MQVVGVIGIPADLLQNDQPRFLRQRPIGGMMMDQPGFAVKAQHRHVAENDPLVLVHEMTGDAGAFGIELFVRGLEFFLLGLY